MNFKRGEIWMADLNPVRGSEQAGMRPVLIFQNNAINRFTQTAMTIPLTTNLRRASLPSCVFIHQGEGGLLGDSVVLCHQMRALDRMYPSQSRLLRKIGAVSNQTMNDVESRVLFTLGIF